MAEPISEETKGEVTFEGTFRILSGDGFYIGFFGDKGDEKEAFVLRQNGGKMYAGNKPLFKTDDAWHYIKFVIDIDKGECRLCLDGKYVDTLPFTGKAKTISRFEFGYGKEDLGEAMIFADTEMYKNYIFCDSIVPKFEGSLPEEYIVEKSGKATLGRRRYTPTSKYSTYFIKAAAGSDTTVTRVLYPQGRSKTYPFAPLCRYGSRIPL